MRQITGKSQTFFLSTLILLLVSIAQGQEIKIENKSDLIFYAPHAAIESSAIEPLGKGDWLIIADDENTNFFVVDAGKISSNTVTTQLLTFPKTFGEKAKWEALAQDDEGTFYVVGSHFADPKKKKPAEKLLARSHLFRFKIKGDGSAAAPFQIDSEPLEWSVKKALIDEGIYNSDFNKNKAKVEGLTVRVMRDAAGKLIRRELIFGLREPSDFVRAYVADITKLPAANAELVLRPLFKFKAGNSESNVPFKLSSLEYVPKWGGFLILTSTEDEKNAFHGNILWFLPDSQIVADKPKIENLNFAEPQKVWSFDNKSKAEGISVISESPSCTAFLTSPSDTKSGKIRLAIVYDNDDEDTCKNNQNCVHSALQIIELTKGVAMKETGNKEFTHELIKDEPYYTTGPQQPRPPDGTFKAGTKVVLVKEAGSYSQVTSETGVTAYVSTASLRQLKVKGSK